MHTFRKALLTIIIAAALLAVSCAPRDISDTTQSPIQDTTSPQMDADAPLPTQTELPTQPTAQPDTTQPPTSPPTEKPTDKPTEKPTEKPTDKPVQKPTDAPKPTQSTGSDKIDKSAYTTVSRDNTQVHTGTLILVNNKIKYTFPENKDLVSVYENKNSTYKVRDTVLQLSSILMDDLNAMLSDFRAKTNVKDMIVISGHRTYDYQKGLFDKEVAQVGAVEAAYWVASPGGSEHHTGLALDFSRFDDEGNSNSYTGEGDYAWINSNCYKYGFIVRYATDKVDITGIKYEPWHFRYVGQPHAGIIVEKGFCYEEYIDYLKGYKFGEQHLNATGADGVKYEIYYVPASTGTATDVPVPKDKSYTISGNNVDGFIVTAVR